MQRLVLKDTLLYPLLTLNFTGFYIILDICILCIFTSLSPSHNHLIKKAGSCWQMGELDAQGLGPWGGATVAAFWDSRRLMGSWVMLVSGEKDHEGFPLPSLPSLILAPG